MKNQYFGDINDYWKYGLLRDLAATGLSVGVCWLLTPDDDGGHGEQRAYVRKPERWESADPPLFDLLRRVNAPDARRDVRLADEHAFIPRARYFHDLLTRERRADYFKKGLEALQPCDAVFFDPDNGVEIATVGRGRHESVKYVFWDELASAYGKGHSLVVYQHIRQVSRSARTMAIAARLKKDLQAPRIDIVGPSRVAFIVVHHPAHTAALSQAIAARRNRWPDVSAEA